MNYNFRNTISNKNISMLKELKRTLVRCIWLDEFADFKLVLCAMIETNKKKYYIFNDEHIESDNDDYPCLSLTSTSTHKMIYNLNINEYVTDIDIIRDNISWEYGNNKWSLICDIAIIIYTSSFKITILIIDSLAGFIEVFVESNSIFLLGDKKDLDNDLNDFWAFKSDPDYIVHFNRTIVKLF